MEYKLLNCEISHFEKNADFLIKLGFVPVGSIVVNETIVYDFELNREIKQKNLIQGFIKEL